MLMKKTAFATALLLITSGAVAAPAAKISMKTARAKAAAQVPGGTIKAAELETEHGKLIYSFDIAPARGSGIEEVQISAIDGSLVSRTHESPAKEKAEARAEAKEKRQH